MSPSPPMTTAAMNNHAASAALRGKEGVCLLEVTYVEWLWQRPWQRCKQERSTGSGFVIDVSGDERGGDGTEEKKKNNTTQQYRILTNAHVVASAIDIRVRLHGSPRRFPAQVEVYAPDVDLALLTIVGEEQSRDFFVGQASSSSLALAFASELPDLQERVHVVGFPTGGKTICVTEGVVSRIDDINLVAPGDAILTIQIDAAINVSYLDPLPFLFYFSADHPVIV
jgi:S1-C subfamily serine protease